VVWGVYNFILVKGKITFTKRPFLVALYFTVAATSTVLVAISVNSSAIRYLLFILLGWLLFALLRPGRFLLSVYIYVVYQQLFFWLLLFLIDKVWPGQVGVVFVMFFTLFHLPIYLLTHINKLGKLLITPVFIAGGFVIYFLITSTLYGWVLAIAVHTAFYILLWEVVDKKHHTGLIC